MPLFIPNRQHCHKVTVSGETESGARVCVFAVHFYLKQIIIFNFYSIGGSKCSDSKTKIGNCPYYQTNYDD